MPGSRVYLGEGAGAHCPLVSPLSREEHREQTNREKIELHTMIHALKEVTAGWQGDLMMQRRYGLSGAVRFKGDRENGVSVQVLLVKGLHCASCVRSPLA